MNAPRPGWHPDPTDRHDYRYWDGVVWTDDVADGGLTAIDPVPDDPGGGAVHHGDRWGDDMGFGQGPLIGQAAHYTGGHARYTDDPRGQPTRYTGGLGAGPAFDDQRVQPTRYTGGFGALDTDDTRVAGAWADEDRYAYRDPAYRSSEGTLAGLSDRRRPSKTLVAGIGLVVIALIAGLAVVLTSGRDGGPATDGTEISEGRGGPDAAEDGDAPATSETTATTAAPGTTAPGAPGGSTATTAPPAPPPAAGEGGGDGGGAGGAEGGGDQEAVDSVAQELQAQAQGGLTEEQSRCMAEGMVDTLGPEVAANLAAGGQPDPSQVSQEDMMALQQAVIDCGVGPAPAG